MDQSGVAGAAEAVAGRTIRVLRSDGRADAVDAIAEAMARRTPGDVVWVDLVDPTKASLDEVAATLGSDVHLHPLVLEDVFATRRRPKVDRFDDHVFLDLVEVTTRPHDEVDPGGDRRRRASLPLSGGEWLTAGAVSAIIHRDRFITIRGAGTLPGITRIVDEWRVAESERRDGPGLVVYTLLDLVVDSVVMASDVLEEDVDELEQKVIEAGVPRTEIQAEAFAVRKATSLVRRVAAPTREAVGQVLRRDGRGFLTVGIADDNVPYLHDVHDHVVRVTESLDALRDELTSVLEFNMALQDNELNEVMKKLSAWAAIIAVPTAVTGYFGQNVPYPGFSEPAGFAMSVAMIVGGALGLWLWFRRLGWL
ncbi:magnesium transporter CorA family protein [Dietzia sp. 179-F 9C3 NHS]|uniref:magnesium transporter CorA family protein n=1 Tax=Dietzia sp. 179-F 9C3 NHS TaxID=3374295 RepID=UPI00387A1C6D